MSLLQWKSEYSVGVDSVDAEHREMIDMINAVYERLRDNDAAAAIEACLEEIYNAISLHFALEERIMRERLYDGYLVHKEDHEELLDQIRDLMDDFVDDPDAGRKRLRQRLSSWFSEHFKNHDARLHGELHD